MTGLLYHSQHLGYTHPTESNPKQPRKYILRNTEFPQIESHHLGLNFHLIELFPAVDTNHTSNHLRYDDHVSEMGLDEIGLLIRFSFLLRFSKFLDQAHWFAFQATIESTARACVHDIAKLLGREVEESVEWKNVRQLRRFRERRTPGVGRTGLGRCLGM